MAFDPSQIDKAAAARFKLVRIFLGLNQTEMGEVCGVSQKMISFMEKGEREISYIAIKNLYIKKNINPVYIFDGDVEMVYGKSPSQKQLLTQIREMAADIEILKAEIRQVKFIKNN